MATSLNFCCTECFADETLKSFVREKGETGDCGFCGAEDVLSIDPYELNELFQPLVGLCEIVEIGVNRTEDEDPWEVGSPLADCIDEDWEVFSDRVSDSKHKLLDDIVNAHHRQEDEIDVNDLWTERSNAFLARSLSELWRGFARSLRYERRFIPKEPEPGESADPRELLEGALPKVHILIRSGTEVFRARLGTAPGDARKPRSIEEMGAPPRELARAGRMNPPGIPYLYLAMSEATAIAEVRPWKGASVSIARYTLPRDFQVADLTDAPGIIPFGNSDLSTEVEQQRLLRFLGREFSRPVNPDAADVDYVPTQYLTELIQDSGFEGILYPSALGSDANLVLFEHKDLAPDQAWLQEITQVAYEYAGPSTRYPWAELW